MSIPSPCEGYILKNKNKIACYCLYEACESTDDMTATGYQLGGNTVKLQAVPTTPLFGFPCAGRLVNIRQKETHTHPTALHQACDLT